MSMKLYGLEQTARYEEAGVWSDETLLERFADTVDRYPDRTAVVDPPNTPELVDREPERLTYAEFVEAVEAVATSLRERGIGKDDFVVAQLPNTWELAMLYLAVARAGAVLSPMPIQWRRHELEHVVDVTEAIAYVGPREFNGFDHVEMATAFADESAILDDVISFADVREFTTADADTAALVDVEVGANEVFNLQWTSGTTADPKACPMTHNNWQSNPTPLLCDMNEGDVVLCAAPLVNMTALGVNYVPWLLTRGTLVLHHPIDLGLMVEQMQDEGVTFTILVPTMLNQLLKHPDVDEFDLSDVETITTGSAAPSEWAMQEFNEQWGIEIINIWGQNEGTSAISGPKTTPLERRATDFPRFAEDVDWGIDDPRIDTVDIRIVNPENGEEVTVPGEVGEVAFKGPGLMAGYYNQPELTADAFDDDGYFYTGDLFQVEEDGYMSFFDRKKDVIIRGGFTISAKEVENIVIEHPKVADAAVVGEPHEDLGERVAVFAAPKPGEDLRLQDITEYMGDDVAVYKRPERLEIVEEIPRNPVGKVVKTDLRERVQSPDSRD
ncbi:class I adenylate-forming enzyme family protein [Natrinema caseinilyticum]|uniref:class I adenylate-forming enzyme family protein n=1 Tax=Natrinema caseinilyticum TaxID=2961570 RepID=UPI0020C59D96|nr:class I adenylate-forming enzyme family protein [Natrinema caseinilyticum]